MEWNIVASVASVCMWLHFEEAGRHTVEWNIVASVATAAAAVVAIIGLFVANASTKIQVAESRRQFAESHKQLDKQLAHDRVQVQLQLAAQDGHLRVQMEEQRLAPLRAQLGEIGFRSRRIGRRVSEGSAIISVCRHAAESILRAAGPRSASRGGIAAAVRRLLLGASPDDAHPTDPTSIPGGAALLPFLLEGWEASPSGQQVVDDVDALVAMSAPLDGDLALIIPCVKMIDSIVTDIRMVMVKAADGEDGTHFRTLLVNSYLASEDPSDITNGMSAALFGNLSAYVVARAYPDILGSLTSLITEACTAFASLDVAELQKGRTAKAPPEAETRTADIRARLDLIRARNIFDDTVVDTLSVHLETLEAALEAKPGGPPGGGQLVGRGGAASTSVVTDTR